MLFAVAFSLYLGVIQAFPDAKAVAEKNTPTVNTPLGTIQGSMMKSRLGKNVFAFRGMPYAKPPVGELRFKPPEPVEAWNGTLDATKDGPACPQVNIDNISEDCLLLNVYSTALKKGDKNPKRPVIVYFHAGGFYSVSGQSTFEGPEYFMDKEVVLVVPNYRLGSLGFLATGDKESPGNNGLKDQVEALKWVKQNIEQFGGDPDLVTIVGYSAGGVSVCLHMISPMSRGLFHRAVAMSGSCVSQWRLPKHQLNLAQKQAKLVGCPDTNSTEIVKCLKTKTAEEIGRSFFGFQEFGSDPILIWSPVIEPDVGQERFMSEDPVELYLEGKQAQVPLMTGISQYEFVYPAYAVVNNASLLDEMNENFDKVAPIAFLFERDTDRSKEISQSLKKFYFHEDSISNTTVTALAQLYADSVIGFGVHRLAQLVAASNINPVYYYRFTYKGRVSHFYIPGTNNTVYGAVHHDELIYLFHASYFPLFKEADPETKIVEHMTSLWTNFARTGNPTPESPELWTRLTAENKKYLNIDESLKMEEKLYEDRYNKWDELFPLKNHHKHVAAHMKHTHG